MSGRKKPEENHKEKPPAPEGEKTVTKTAGMKLEEKAKAEEQLQEKIQVSRQEYEELQKEAQAAAEYRDKVLRTLAEMDNLRKRLEKEKREFMEFAHQELVGDILPVLDNFHRALSAVPPNFFSDPYLQGIEMIYKQLKEALQKQGLEEIKAVGERFDPLIHEAVKQEVSDAFPEGTVMEELLKGYLFRGRLLRPAAVTVSRGPSASGPAPGRPEGPPPDGVIP